MTQTKTVIEKLGKDLKVGDIVYHEGEFIELSGIGVKQDSGHLNFKVNGWRDNGPGFYIHPENSVLVQVEPVSPPKDAKDSEQFMNDFCKKMGYVNIQDMLLNREIKNATYFIKQMFKDFEGYLLTKFSQSSQPLTFEEFCKTHNDKDAHVFVGDRGLYLKILYEGYLLGCKGVTQGYKEELPKDYEPRMAAILDKHYVPRMHWKGFNRTRVIIAMAEFAQYYANWKMNNVVRTSDKKEVDIDEEITNVRNKLGYE